MGISAKKYDASISIISFCSSKMIESSGKLILPFKEKIRIDIIIIIKKIMINLLFKNLNLFIVLISRNVFIY